MLSDANGFQFHASGQYNHRPWTSQLEKDFTRFIANHSDFVYDRHFYYVDFSSHGQDSPTYFNVVRDPIERFVSAFNYARREKRWAGKPERPPQASILRITKSKTKAESFFHKRL